MHHGNTTHTRTCVVTVVLSEGTHEIRFVGKKLFSKDFEGGAFSSSDTVNKTHSVIINRNSVT